MMNGGATVPKTRWMHTDEVKRAALILGIIEDYSRASVFKVNLILKRRLADERIVKENWHSDSELRARVRYLIRRSRILMNGGYRRLLWGTAARRAGEFPMPDAVPSGRKPAGRNSPYTAG